MITAPRQRTIRVLVHASHWSRGDVQDRISEIERNSYRNTSISRPTSFQSVMRTCNSTVARQNNNSDSDFMPGLKQIQDLRTPKYINIIYQVMGTRTYEFCLAEQKHGI